MPLALWPFYRRGNYLLAESEPCWGHMWEGVTFSFRLRKGGLPCGRSAGSPPALGAGGGGVGLRGDQAAGRRAAGGRNGPPRAARGGVGRLAGPTGLHFWAACGDSGIHEHQRF